MFFLKVYFFAKYFIQLNHFHISCIIICVIFRMPLGPKALDHLQNLIYTRYSINWAYTYKCSSFIFKVRLGAPKFVSRSLKLIDRSITEEYTMTWPHHRDHTATQWISPINPKLVARRCLAGSKYTTEKQTQKHKVLLKQRKKRCENVQSKDKKKLRQFSEDLEKQHLFISQSAEWNIQVLPGFSVESTNRHTNVRKIFSWQEK